MKRNIFTHTAIIFSLLLTAGCSNALQEGNAPLPQTQKSDPNAVSIQIQIGNGDARTALPDVHLDDLTFISLSYIDNVEGEMYNAGQWESAEKMNSASIPFQTGTYTFQLFAACSNIIYSAQIDDKTITTGVNTLIFEPELMVLAYEGWGTGDISVNLKYPPATVKKITGGLYTLDEQSVPGYADEDLPLQQSGNTLYAKTNVESGKYLTVFKLYADDEKKQLLATYREVTVVSDGLESISTCTLRSVGKLFSISYAMNGGTFNEGTAKPVSYTRQTPTISLPTDEDITRAGYVFGGWYENEFFTGNAVTQIPSGSTGNKTLYAKWTKLITVTFSKNHNNAQITTTSQIIKEGVPTPLTLASDLNLVSPANSHFLGWATAGNATQVTYLDGQTVTLSRNTQLYALWSVSRVQPEQDDNTDSDGDGIPDYAEVYTWHTDPLNPDSDGDGWKDGVEINLFNAATNEFNPRIADVPALDIDFARNPNIFYMFETSTTSGDSEEVSMGESHTQSSSQGSSNSRTRSETHGWAFSTGFEAKWAADFEFTWKGEGQYNGNVTTGDEYTYSAEVSDEKSHEWSNSKTISTEKGQTVSGGKLVVAANLSNPSSIGYTVQNVTVSVSRIPNNSSKLLIPIASKTIENVGTIAPGGQAGPFNIEFELDLQSTEDLLKWSNGIDIQVASYTINCSRGGDSSDFTEELTRVRAQTAAVYIDYGPLSGRTRQSDTYNVAAKTYNSDAATFADEYTQNNLLYVLEDIIGLTRGDASDGFTMDEHGALTSIYGIANNETNVFEGAWYICHRFTKNGQRKFKIYGPTEDREKIEGTYNLERIVLHAGDEVSIIYTRDEDQDRVPLNEEIIYGTDDTLSDTDGDGLTDYEEIYGWYRTGLNSKYSTSKPVCTNPLNDDTDGDELPDWDNEQNKVADTDPIIPKLKDDTRLADTPSYSLTGEEDSFTNTISFSGTSKPTASIDVANEYIWLDINPKVAFAQILYKTDKKGSQFKALDKATSIQLNIGRNDITIRCIAPDEKTTKDYVLTVNSQFHPLENFAIDAPQNQGGKLTFRWDEYSDDRASKSDGGYILYGKQGTGTMPESLDRAKISDITQDGTDLSKLGEFCVKLSAQVLKNGSITLTNLATHTGYTFGLYAYAHSNTSSTYKSKRLAWGTKTTSNKATGKLTLYAHYIWDYKDQDGGCDPEYYWTFKCTSGSGIGAIGDLNIGSDEKKEFDDDDDTAYCFGKSKIHKYRNDPQRYSECTKALSTEYTRTENHSFTITWEAWEYDRGSPDDYLGKVTATFSYSSETDKWTVSWTSTTGGDYASGTRTITSGQKTSDTNAWTAWDLRNTSEGEIGFYWDLGWE